MSHRRYTVYARRTGERNFSEWCRAENEEKAIEYCVKIRRLGFRTKVYDVDEKKVVLEDD